MLIAVAIPRRQETTMGEIMPQFENSRVVTTTTEARAGTTGHHMRYVLLLGTVGTAALFAIIYLAFFS